MPPKVKSQNLSIMLTDLQGYTATSTKCSREEIISLIRRYNKLLAPMIEFYGGKVIKTIGDAFLATFQSATDAVICAILIQLVLRDYNQKQSNEILKMNTRVVVHSGDVSIENNDIYGDAVNVTARIEGLDCFPGGSIGISETTYLLMDKNEIVAEKIGPKQLKGIPDPITVYRVPLEKQKIKETPAHLSSLIARCLSSDGDQEGLGLTEWTSSVQSFLKEKNWGESLKEVGKNIKSQIGGNIETVQKKIGQNIGNVQKQLVQTFTQKTVLEQKKGASLSEAPLDKRVKSFLIDTLILLIAGGILRVVWSLSAGLFLFGFLEILGHLVLSLVLLAFSFFYFAVFWKLKGATPGQIAIQTAVVMEDGSEISWQIALKRSALFLGSCIFFFLGVALIFVGEQKTFYDLQCKTKVVG